MNTVRCTASALVIRSLPLANPSTDTGKRMVRGQIAQTHGVSWDQKWLYVDAPQGRGWCARAHLKEAVPFEVNVKVITPTPAWPKVPRGLDEIQRLFGTPGNAMASAGRVSLPAPLKLGWSEQRIEGFACHKLLEDVFTSAFKQIHERGFWPLLKSFDGCYNDRSARGLAKKSTHAWGIAVDLNAATNQLGAKPTMDPRIVAIFRDHGFLWGGMWARPDGMHFQYATGY